MKRLGTKKTATLGPGHQDCGVCHPETKGGKALERRRVEAEVHEALFPRLSPAPRLESER